MNVILWARVSSREQREGYSIDAQLRVMEEKVERMGWHAVKTFTVAESARRGADRKAFNDMVMWVRKNAARHKIKAVLSHKLDRVCRNMRDAVRMQELEDRYGVQMAFVDNEFSPTAAGTLSFNVMAAVAQYYSDNLRTEVLKGITEKARQGWAPGMAPFGYINDGQDRDEPIKPHPERARTLQRIFELYARGGYTFKSLTDQLLREGHVYRSSQPKFHRTALSHILNNRFYIGEIRLRDQKFTGKHRLLIERAVFERCQDILHGKNRRTGNATIPLAGGLFRCAYCGSSVTGERIKRKLKGGGVREHLYYRCANNQKDADHPQVRWKAEDMENAILEDLKSMVLPDARVRTAFRRTLEVALGDAAECRREQSRQARKRLAEVASMKERLLNAYLMGTIDETTLRNRTVELEAEMKSLRNAAGPMTVMNDDGVRDRIDEMDGCGPSLLPGVPNNDREDDRMKRILSVFDLAQNIESLWRGSNSPQKRRILEAVSLNRQVSDVSLCIQKTKPFDLLGKQPAFVESRGDRI
jgi:site-specific DNA recombinase